MIQEATLPEMMTRLQVIEDEVHTMKSLLQSEPTPPLFEFVIWVDEREVWSGLEVDACLPEILQEYPNAQITIGWRSSSSMVWI